MTRSEILHHRSSGGTGENHENLVITVSREEIKRKHVPNVEHKCRPLPRDFRCSDLLLEWLNSRVRSRDKPVACAPVILTEILRGFLQSVLPNSGTVPCNETRLFPSISL